MSIFGWSYPPGAENDPFAPYNQDFYDDELPTVREFCSYFGLHPLDVLLRAIDRRNIEAVDVRIAGTDEWITPDWSGKCSEDDPISHVRVRGTAWDGSDWEWGQVVKMMSPDSLEDVGDARSAFHDALHEYEAERDAEDPDYSLD